MIFRSNNVLSPTVDITIFGVYIDYARIVQVELELAENQHDLVRVVMTGIPPEAVTDYMDAPIVLKWFQDEMGHEFRGYVTFVEPSYVNSEGLSHGSPFQLTTLYCLGASYDMKAKQTRVWDKPTLNTIVKYLADTYQYSYSIPVEPFQWVRLVQSEESDWEFLVRVCSTLGYVVTVHGTHIHVFDRYKAIGRQISLHLLEPPAENPKIRPGQILNFKGTFGYTTPYSTSNDERIVTMDNTGALVDVSTESRDSSMGTPLPSRFTDTLAMNLVSADYAEGVLEARARDKFPFGATCALTGTAGVKPGGMVDIQRFNSRFDGLWYVSKVCHTITFDKFFTELTVLKDSTNDDPFRIPAVKEVGEIPSSVLKDSIWSAETQMEETYG